MSSETLSRLAHQQAVAFAEWNGASKLYAVLLQACAGSGAAANDEVTGLLDRLREAHAAARDAYHAAFHARCDAQQASLSHLQKAA